MDEPLISIIIPVYNEEKYLSQSINSLLCQTYPYFECICIDDGSSDNSCQILREYEKNDNRVIVIAQKNQYAGVARNIGLSVAKGKYVLFLDADDFFCLDMLGVLAKKAEETQAEILVFDAFPFDDVSQKVLNKDKSFFHKEFSDKKILSAEEMAEYIFTFVNPAPWNKLFLRTFILENDIWFQQLQRANDVYFVFTAFSCAKKIVIVDNKLLYYRENNPLSLQGSWDYKTIVFTEALLALKRNLEKREVFDVYQKSFWEMSLMMYIGYLNKTRTATAYYKFFNEMKNDIYSKLLFEKQNMNECIKTALYNHEPLIIYGAGTISKAFTRYLLLQCGYSKENLSVVVTNKSQNEENIWGIKVNNFRNISKKYCNRLILIAIQKESLQRKIVEKIHEQGFKRYEIVGVCEMMSLFNDN